jgi:hypothetical protein
LNSWQTSQRYGGAYHAPAELYNPHRKKWKEMKMSIQQYPKLNRTERENAMFPPDFIIFRTAAAVSVFWRFAPIQSSAPVRVNRAGTPGPAKIRSGLGSAS